MKLRKKRIKMKDKIIDAVWGKILRKDKKKILIELQKLWIQIQKNCI